MGVEATQGHMGQGKGFSRAEGRPSSREHCVPAGFPRRGRRSLRCKGRVLGAGRKTGSSSDGSAAFSLGKGAWVHCPRPWDVRVIGREGTGSSHGSGVTQCMFGSSGSQIPPASPASKSGMHVRTIEP